MAITEELGYSKFCASLVPLMVPYAPQETRQAITTELSCQCNTGSENFLSQIVMGDETWAHCFEPESMQKSTEWPNMVTPRKKKLKSAQSAGKIMVALFWDDKDIILVNFLSRGIRMSFDCYTDTQKSLNAHHHQVCPTRNMS